MALKSSEFWRGGGKQAKVTTTCDVLNYGASRENSEKGECLGGMGGTIELKGCGGVL